MAPGHGATDEAEARAALEHARRRATMVVVLDWIAIVVLVLVRARAGAIFAVGPNEESIFAIGLLAIAVHSGFRLGQLEKIRAVRRALDELEERSGSGDHCEPRN